jgi:hypothetical protein
LSWEVTLFTDVDTDQLSNHVYELSDTIATVQQMRVGWSAGVQPLKLEPLARGVNPNRKS